MEKKSSENTDVRPVPAQNHPRCLFLLRKKNQIQILRDFSLFFVVLSFFMVCNALQGGPSNCRDRFWRRFFFFHRPSGQIYSAGRNSMVRGLGFDVPELCFSQLSQFPTGSFSNSPLKKTKTMREKKKYEPLARSKSTCLMKKK